MFEYYDGDIDTLPPVTGDMVEEAVTALERIAPDDAGLNEEDSALRWVLDDFIDLSSRYCNRPLPSYRDWNVTYKHTDTDNILDQRDDYEYDDQIPSDPIIDGTRYESTRREYNGSDLTVYVKPDPLRNDIHVFINTVGSRKDFVNLATHPGPDNTDPKSIVNQLCSEFDWGMKGDTEAILRAPEHTVLGYIEQQGWEYDTAPDVTLD